MKKSVFFFRVCQICCTFAAQFGGECCVGAVFGFDCLRKVAQLVAHYVRDVGVGRSSRLFPTEIVSSGHLAMLCAGCPDCFPVVILCEVIL